MKIRCAEAFIRTLEKESIKYVFGVPGHGNMHILDALYERNKIKFMLTRHEQAAAHIADGYARIRREIGVCTSSVGPGATNMITGIAAAAAGSSPILAVSGGIIAGMYGKGQLQATERPENKMDQSFIQMLQPLIKKGWQVEHPETICDITRQAIILAKSGRPGPVAIEIPWDVQSEEVDIDIPDVDRFRRSSRIRPDVESLKKAAVKIAQAKFPLIIAGYGTVLSEADSEVKELAELLGAPVATSFMSKGVIPEDHELSVGILGWLGHPVAHELVREYADYILAVGYRFSDEATSFWTEGLPFVRENRFIQIDILPQELGRNYPIEVGLQGDAKATLIDLISILRSQFNVVPSERNIKLVKKMKSSFSFDVPTKDGTPMEPIKIVEEMRKVLPRNSIVLPDTGAHTRYFATCYPSYGSHRLLCPGSWACMGWSPTAVIGAKLAEPDTPCISATGDGGFLMTIQEIITAAEWKVPVVWMVFNNSSLAAIREGQIADYGGHVIGTEFGLQPDFSKIARAFLAEGVRVSKVSEIAEAMEFALNCGKPCVIDMLVELDPMPVPCAGDFLTPGRHIPRPIRRGEKTIIATD